MDYLPQPAKPVSPLDVRDEMDIYETSELRVAHFLQTCKSTTDYLLETRGKAMQLT